MITVSEAQTELDNQRAADEDVYDYYAELRDEMRGDDD